MEDKDKYIEELEAIIERLNDKNKELENEVTYWKNSHENLTTPGLY